MNKVLIALLGLFTLGSCATSNGKQAVAGEAQYEIILPHAKHRVNKKDRVVIAVIDTGFDEETYGKDVKICDEGSKDFTSDVEEGWRDDNHNHGTHIAGLIDMNSKVDYCLIILKYYDKDKKYQSMLLNTINAFEHAIDLDVDMINYSGGGKGPDKYEKAIIKRALDRDIVVVAAAGNEGKSFKEQGYYPAMYYPSIIVVGNLTKNKEGKVIRAPSSNWGKQVDLQVFGTRIKSINGRMTGTSQSTAIVTGRLTEYVKNYRATEMIRKYYHQGTDSYHSPLYKYMGK